METWFILALASTISGGISSFLLKIVAVRKVSITILTLYSGVVSTFIILASVLLFADFSNLWHPMLFFAFVAGVTFFMTSVIKVEALKVIDTAIFFPVYKVTGPFFAILIGVAAFSERFTHLEWTGLILSLLVPLMLITKSENVRQTNLLRGILLTVFCAAVGAISISFAKQGTSITENIWMYLLLGEFFTATAALTVFVARYKKNTLHRLKKATDAFMIVMSLIMGSMFAFGTLTLMFALYVDGPLGIVYTINSLYILIPIILSIVYYSEHWNARKVVAIVLSIAALALLK